MNPKLWSLSHFPICLLRQHWILSSYKGKMAEFLTFTPLFELICSWHKIDIMYSILSLSDLSKSYLSNPWFENGPSAATKHCRTLLLSVWVKEPQRPVRSDFAALQQVDPAAPGSVLHCSASLFLLCAFWAVHVIKKRVWDIACCKIKPLWCHWSMLSISSQSLNSCSVPGCCNRSRVQCFYSFGNVFYMSALCH